MLLNNVNGQQNAHRQENKHKPQDEIKLVVHTQCKMSECTDCTPVHESVVQYTKSVHTCTQPQQSEQNS